MKIKLLFILGILSFSFLNISLKNGDCDLKIKSIKKVSDSIYIIKAINFNNRKFKIISILENNHCNNNRILKIEHKYSIKLNSVFSGISLGNKLSKYTIKGVTISTEPELGYDDLYNTKDLDGLCIK